MTGFVHCPCCALPTLNTRGDAEICPICWWEDDGRDDGPELTRARDNYADHFDRYDPGTGIGTVTNPSLERLMLLAYLKSVRAGKRGYDERKLHGLLRGLGHA